METQAHKNTKIYVGTHSPRSEKPGDKFRIISLYQIEITTLIDTTWVKKNSIFLFTHYSFSHFVFSLTLSIFFSLLLAFSNVILQDCTNPQSHLLGLLFSLGFTSSPPRDFTFSAHLHWPNGLSIYFSISHSFLPFTLFTSSHNKCNPLTLTLLQPKTLSSALIGRMAVLVSFLSSFPQFSQLWRHIFIYMAWLLQIPS